MNTLNEIKLIKQVDDTGCGIACVASVTNKSYDEIKDEATRIFNWTNRRGTFYLRVRDLDKLLSDLHVDFVQEKFQCWEKITGVFIVGVRIPNSNSGYHHWIVAAPAKERLLVMDPIHGKCLDGRKKENQKLVQGRKGSIMFRIADQFNGSVII